MTIKDLERDLNSRGGNLSGIYKITRKSDGKVYIGQSECITKRIIQHINNVRETNSDKIDGAIQAEGWENFTYEVELALPELNTEQLWLAESSYIAKYNSQTTGFNKTKGNHIGKYDHAEFARKNVVPTDVTKRISNHFRLILKNKKILLVNLFDKQFVNMLQYNDCIVTQISRHFESKEDLGNYIRKELQNFMNVKFDLIIANPPYGSIGANITKTIIDTIEFDDFINLLPVNDYNRNTTKDLYKYVDLDSVLPIGLGFSDTNVTTHAVRITKRQRRYITWDEFEIENYVDDSLTKYFYENRNRTYSAIDEASSWLLYNNCDVATDVVLPHKFVYNKVFYSHINSYTREKRLSVRKEGVEYLWNTRQIDDNWLIKENLSPSTPGKMNKYNIKFNTSAEKDNFVTFIHSDQGFRFIGKILMALNSDSTVELFKWIPKVDWARSWTVEEILKEYGYTQKEIDEVINDLVNYKGMED